MCSYTTVDLQLYTRERRTTSTRRRPQHHQKAKSCLHTLVSLTCMSIDMAHGADTRARRIEGFPMAFSAWSKISLHQMTEHTPSGELITSWQSRCGLCRRSKENSFAPSLRSRIRSGFGQIPLKYTTEVSFVIFRIQSNALYLSIVISISSKVIYMTASDIHVGSLTHLFAIARIFESLNL